MVYWRIILYTAFFIRFLEERGNVFTRRILDSASCGTRYMKYVTNLSHNQTCASCEKRCLKVAEGTIIIVVTGSWNCSGSTCGSCSNSTK
jgi:hypothetical protein